MEGCLKLILNSQLEFRLSYALYLGELSVNLLPGIACLLTPLARQFLTQG
jgi:hypothetical protein